MKYKLRIKEDVIIIDTQCEDTYSSLIDCLFKYINLNKAFFLDVNNNTFSFHFKDNKNVFKLFLDLLNITNFMEFKIYNSKQHIYIHKE